MKMKQVRYPTRVTVDFPKDLYNKLHINKLVTKETVKDCIIRAVTEMLKREEKK